MKSILSILLLSSILFAGTPSASEKIFVVERESESIAVINKGLTKSHMKNVHNMNHGIIKFDGADGYLISRDGYVVRFDPVSEKILNEYKTSKSAIGFVIGKNYVAVANYDDKSVDILTRDLNPIDKIVTGSKNVGIKIYKDMIIFAQMDSDKVTVLKNENAGKGLPKFKIFKEFKVGEMPFDAMIKDHTYIVGFFLTKAFGVIDLDKMEFSEIKVDPKDFGIMYSKSAERISLEASLELVKNPSDELLKLAQLNAAVILFLTGKVESIEEGFEVIQ